MGPAVVLFRCRTAWVLAAALAGCAGGAGTVPVAVVDRGANAVSLRGERGAATILQPPSATGTPEERRPIYNVDRATLHLAMHRAVGAAPAAAQEAAAHAAGHAVLQRLFPQRGPVDQAAYDNALASLPAGAARDEGVRIGIQQAARVLAGAREEEDARFHTNPPPLYWTRNLNRFARSQLALADNARLMALLWVTHNDAVLACFDAKYHHQRWRPVSAIAGVDPAWRPRLPTPNHPEYPAAHGCTTAAMAENLATQAGTRALSFAFDSSATGTVHTWHTVDAAVHEVREARIIGGMHFRSAMLAGEQLGIDVARHVARHLDDRP